MESFGGFPVREHRYTSRKCRCGATSSGVLRATGPGSPPARGSRWFVPGSEVWTSDQTGAAVMACRACGAPVVAHRIRGVRNPAVRCDARCTSAKGFSCECSCGGKNHGAGFGSGR